MKIDFLRSLTTVALLQLPKIGPRTASKILASFGRDMPKDGRSFLEMIRDSSVKGKVINSIAIEDAAIKLYPNILFFENVAISSLIIPKPGTIMIYTAG